MLQSYQNWGRRRDKLGPVMLPVVRRKSCFAKDIGLASRYLVWTFIGGTFLDWRYWYCDGKGFVFDLLVIDLLDAAFFRTAKDFAIVKLGRYQTKPSRECILTSTLILALAYTRLIRRYVWEGCRYRSENQPDQRIETSGRNNYDWKLLLTILNSNFLNTVVFLRNTTTDNDLSCWFWDGIRQFSFWNIRRP